MLLDLAIIFSLILVFGFALLQLLLVFGAPFGEYVLGGLHKVLPPRMRVISGAFSLLFIFVGVSFLQKMKLISDIFPPSAVNILLIIYTLFLAYAIVGNGILTKSRKEKYVMTPLSIIGFISSVIVLICSW